MAKKVKLKGSDKDSKKLIGDKTNKPLSERTINDYAVLARKMRKGARDNQDGTQSTVKMAWAEGDGKYYVYPTLFQNDDGSWLELSDEDNWAAMNEAFKRGEVFEFLSEQQAKDFAEGAWKKREPLQRKKVKKIEQKLPFSKLKLMM